MSGESEKLPIMQSCCPQAEDVLLRRLFHDRPFGFFVDVGAGDPVDCSVTHHLYTKLGWTGINLEPNPVVYKRLCKMRPKDTNKNFVVRNETGVAMLRVFAGHENRSTINEYLKKQYRWWRNYKDYSCEARRLDDILEVNATGKTIDLLKIDVEGSEYEVLKSINLHKWRPLLVVVEATVPGEPTPTYDEWEHMLLDAGYTRALFDGLNCWYSYDDEIISILSVPVNVFDNYDAYRWKKHRKVLSTVRQ